MTALEPAALECLDRTRSAVVNVLMVVGLGIAVAGIYLGRRDRGALLWSEREMGRGAHALLFVIIVASFAVRRVVASRAALRDPAGRAPRFFRAHVASAILGALAMPLGALYGWAIRPRLDAVLPFWVAALALGVLALPRSYELEGFEEPIPRAGKPT
ncbi:MAG TPA: hypothetical protein VGY53_03230 [Isosphaeraceae bacterium]|nr:hypothetical protein [Isosphaeraceae bacterium]